MTGLTQVPERYARRMRNPGENAGGRAPGRRQGASGRTSPPEERSATAARPGAGGAGAGRPGAGRPGTGGGGRGGSRRPGGLRLSATRQSSNPVILPGGPRPAARPSRPPRAGTVRPCGAAGKGPVRGFPPAPGQPTPMYPPGPFEAWNRTSGGADNGYEAADAWGYQETAGYPVPGPGSTETGYEVGYSDRGYTDAGYDRSRLPAAARTDGRWAGQWLRSARIRRPHRPWIPASRILGPGRQRPGRRHDVHAGLAGRGQRAGQCLA